MSSLFARPPSDLALTNFTAENATIRNNLNASNISVERHVQLDSVTLHGFTIRSLMGGVFPSSVAGSTFKGQGFTATIQNSLSGTVTYTTPLSGPASVRLTAQVAAPPAVTVSLTHSDATGFSYISGGPTVAIHFTAVN